MKNTLFRVLGRQLAHLERTIGQILPIVSDAQFLAVINDFGTGRLKAYFSDQCFARDTLSVNLAASDVVRMLRRRSPVLPDKSELQALKVDLGLDETSFQDVCSALSFVEDHLGAVRKGLAEPPLSFEVSSRTAWCLANCPGQSSSGLPQFQPDFYVLDAGQDSFCSAAALMVDLSRGDVVFGVRLAETMSVDRLTVRSFIANALDGLPTAPQVSAVGDPADVLSDLVLDHCFIRHSPVQLFVPLYDAIFLTGILVVNLRASQAELRECGDAVRAEMAHFLFGAAADVTRAVFFGRQRIAMDTLGRGIVLDGSPESFNRLTRVMKLAQPIFACTPQGDDELLITYQQRYLPSTVNVDAVSVRLTANTGAANESLTNRGTNPELTLLQEQINHILQYNHMLYRERREVIKWVAHTVASRLADLGRSIAAKEPDYRIAKKKFDAVNTVFDAARYLTRGEKYRPPDIVPFDPDMFGKAVSDYLASECGENRRLVEALRKAILWDVFKESPSFDVAQERLRGLAASNQLFTIACCNSSGGSAVHTSTSILQALIQEVTLNALEYNDWQRTPWTPIAIGLDGSEGQVTVTNAVPLAKIASVQTLKLGFDSGDGNALSMGLTLVSELYSPVICKRAYFELQQERAPDGSSVAGTLIFRARLKAL